MDQIFQQLREEVPNDILLLLPRQEIPIITHDNHQEFPPPTQEIANATQADPAMATLMTTIMANMEAMRLRIEGQDYNVGRRTNNRGRGRGRGRGCSTGRGGRGGGRTPQRRRCGHYCLTHGNCAHDGSDYDTPGPNHNPEAAFANMMGGSTANCD